MIAGDYCVVKRHEHGKAARVMAVAEGYAMLRYRGCAPFLERVKDLSLDTRLLQSDFEGEPALTAAMTHVGPGAPRVTTYQRGCRCADCQKHWREYARKRRTQENTRLAAELDAAELDAAEAHVDALREENAMLCCRLQELEWETQN